ncbi:golgin subfamily B member 1-like isoform X2 [Dendronephthya gigantea]|uniref:golgin subfamily B member 1-like isoform X2 n=1 Tax=Dendronephthya gigantea TaxID=151771 RepID=UPI00106BCFE4|nr:golgin subfamily B member 1-like isoform X2 [Dendronephthya gigantea]
MCTTQESCQELVIRPNFVKPNSFQKATARLTIISVLSRQVNTKSPFPRNEHSPIEIPETRKQEPPRISENSAMSSTNILLARREGHLSSVTEGSNESIEDKDGESKGCNGVNGGVKQWVDGGKNGGQSTTSGSTKDPEVFHKTVNGKGWNKDPFEYMKERKLSEPVLSPRKKTSVVTPRLTRCRSSADLRENEQPTMILRELGGYKFFAKPSEAIANTSNRKAYKSKANENKAMSEVSALKKTVTEQKENITNRERHLLHLEKKIGVLEHENSKNKKQILSFREKLKDCSGTIDYLRREKEVLATERDRLSFTLLTCEHELKELRAQNMNLVTEYESAEHSRKIAVSHLHEAERVCQESHHEKPEISTKRTVEDSSSSEKLITQLTSMKEAVQKLRIDRKALQIEQRKVASFFFENLKQLVSQVRDAEKQQKRSSEESHLEVSQNSPDKVTPSVLVTNSEDVFEEPDDLTTIPEDISDLGVFKKKLKSNERTIDDLANKIRHLENKKKRLLEARFAMIQEFQASREVVGDLETDMSGNDSEEKMEYEIEGGDQKRARVTKKIRKLERTLSMDHGVGKLDCIQKLCKNLEDCEQRIHELEATNSELRAEHADMEEEAKYLKYVLSYRGDVMKAQLKSEYENKMAALRDELENVNSSRSEVQALTKRNRDLEEEVQRLHEELSTLLRNLPALQAIRRSSSRNSEHENDVFTADVSMNLADVSSNLDNTMNSEEVPGNTDKVSENGPQANQSKVPESESSLGNSSVISQKDADSSLGSEAALSLEDQVSQLTEKKRVLLMSMLALKGENGSESDSSFSRNVEVLERSFREIEQENACFSETLQRFRDVLGEKCEHENESGDVSVVTKLRDEIQRLDARFEACRTQGTSFEKDNTKLEAILSCARHEERISELEMEIYRLHEEKKSLLSSIVRLQTDPNFTLSDDVNDSDLINDNDVIKDNTVLNNNNANDSLAKKDIGVVAGDTASTSQGNDGIAGVHNSLVKTYSRDEEVQISPLALGKILCKRLNI